MIRRASSLVCIVALLACACSGQSGSPTAPPITPPAGSLQASLSAAFDSLAIPGNAGCSLSVSQQGQVVFEGGRGQVAPGRAASGDSLYRIASLTKPITASAALISEQAGRLSRGDKINRFLAYPEPAPTIDELIRHVPGLPNFQLTAAYQSGYSSPTTVENLLSLVAPWDGVRRYQYSNSHAVLVAAALQQVNGIRYEEIVQRDIFGPAAMLRSSFSIPSASESVGVPAFPVTHPTWVFGAGSITSTAADMNRFNQALLSNRFGFGSLESLDPGGGSSRASAWDPPSQAATFASRTPGCSTATARSASFIPPIDPASSFSATSTAAAWRVSCWGSGAQCSGGSLANEAGSNGGRARRFHEENNADLVTCVEGS